MACCPTVIHQDGSCIKHDILKEMVLHYNKKNNKNIDINLPKNRIILEFEKKFGKKHNLWKDQIVFQDLPENILNELEKFTFRADGPQGNFEWLSTVDLNQVLEQYELKYPDFKFLGSLPIDFNELSNMPFKNFNLNNFRNKKRFGSIFNLDEHYKSGSHWVSLFFDFSSKKIYFCDSVGNEPEKRIKSLIDKIIKQMGDNYEYKYNKTKHQKGGSECGVYSINFILRLLKGKNFDDMMNNRISDEKINKCRSVYFNKK